MSQILEFIIHVIIIHADRQFWHAAYTTKIHSTNFNSLPVSKESLLHVACDMVEYANTGPEFMKNSYLEVRHGSMVMGMKQRHSHFSRKCHYLHGQRKHSNQKQCESY